MKKLSKTSDQNPACPIEPTHTNIMDEPLFSAHNKRSGRCVFGCVQIALRLDYCHAHIMDVADGI